ncbi:MAG: conserved rane protein of unknown function [Candidatus Saccharibacteria bacterium]|nr:conserved rane protein of unknown function [Candidatus Saccharibacteria bacterium]
MKVKINRVITTLILALLFAVGIPFAAANAAPAAQASPAPAISITSDDLHLGSAPKTIGADNVTNLLNAVYFVAGITAIIVIIVGGIRYAAANGDSSQIQAAKNMITYAVVGLVVIIMAAAITQFVITSIGK